MDRSHSRRGRVRQYPFDGSGVIAFYAAKRAAREQARAAREQAAAPAAAPAPAHAASSVAAPAVEPAAAAVAPVSASSIAQMSMVDVDDAIRAADAGAAGNPALVEQAIMVDIADSNDGGAGLAASAVPAASAAPAAPAASAASAAPAAPAPIPAVLAPVMAPPTRTEFMESVANRMLDHKTVGIAQLDILPVPDGITPDEVKELRDQGGKFFARLFYRNEDIVHAFLTTPDMPANQRVADALSYVLRCSPDFHPTAIRIAETDADNRLVMCDLFRHTIRTELQWMDEYEVVRNFIHADNELRHEPSDAVVAAWRTITFVPRAAPNASLIRRRDRQLVKVHITRLFDIQPPEPDRPNATDVERYWFYQVYFGTLEQMKTQFKFDPERTHVELEQRLCDRFPGWESRHGRAKEAYDEQKLVGVYQPRWQRDVARFQRYMTDYMTHILDTDFDRRQALAFLLRVHGAASITPVLVFRIMHDDMIKVHDDKRHYFADFIETAWAPFVKPDYATIIKEARCVHNLYGVVAFAAFVVGAMPDFLNWPCDADTAFVRELLVIGSVNNETRFRILEGVLVGCVPDGAAHMTPNAIERFLFPLWSRIEPYNVLVKLGRSEIMCRYIATWSIPIPPNVGACLRDFSAGLPNHMNVQNAIETQRQVVRERVARARLTISKFAGMIKDEAAAKDVGDDATCVVCTINVRRVCFVPCGHIVACIACSVKWDGPCPICRAAIIHTQPCLLPA